MRRLARLLLVVVPCSALASAPAHADDRSAGAASGPRPQAPVEPRPAGTAGGPRPQAPAEPRPAGTAGGPRPQAPAEPPGADTPAPPPPPPAPSWATTQATELTRQARDHAARGDSAAAVTRYVEAVKLDPTYGPAYLGLAAEYEARGDLREAERTYAVGLDHVAGFTDALLARARLRTRLRRADDAVADLESAAALDPDAHPVLRELAAAYVARRALPAALSVYRRALRLAEARRDAPAAAEARVQVKALSLLVGEVDPVAAGKAGRGPVRRALWAVSRKR